jgi:hypothetical protein
MKNLVLISFVMLSLSFMMTSVELNSFFQIRNYNKLSIEESFKKHNDTFEIKNNKIISSIQSAHIGIEARKPKYFLLYSDSITNNQFIFFVEEYEQINPKLVRRVYVMVLDSVFNIKQRFQVFKDSNFNIPGTDEELGFMYGDGKLLLEKRVFDLNNCEQLKEDRLCNSFYELIYYNLKIMYLKRILFYFLIHYSFTEKVENG